MANKSPILVIVESPTKAKTISRILGKKYIVEASVGHLRDLPKASLGVDIDKDFEPQYVIPTRSRKTVTKLKKLYEKADSLILATDEDREGEAIGWHITEALKVPKDQIVRIVFHEITDEAVQEAMANPRKIDMNLVHAQQARRVLDRLVGYKLSPLLWKKIFRGLSAGRVQSVALRLIVERERERDKFVPEEYWSVKVIYKIGKNEFEADLVKVDGEKLKVVNEKEATKIVQELKKDSSVVTSVQDSERERAPLAPFTTSTLQQRAGTQLGFSIRKTMVVAQQLYEGISLGDGNQIGLITYMRTDSTYVSAKAISEMRDWVAAKFGKEFIPISPRVYKTKSKRAQEAHEAVRSTSALRTPEDIEQYLSPDQFRLYRLIWERTVASQMASAVISQKDIEITSDNKMLTVQGVSIKFPGFMKIMSKVPIKEQQLPVIEIDNKLDVSKVDPQQKFTEPSARYTEPTLVKTLEKLGIGRPSTYAPTITTIIARGYVRKEQKQLVPQEVGLLVNDFLVKHFAEVIDTEFTANMENSLDEVAEGKLEWNKIIRDFYGPFAKKLAEKEENVTKHELNETTDEKCDKCGASMIVKMGRFGKFLACSKFPECKGTKSLGMNIKPIMKCPKCKKGDVVNKRTRKGKIFYGCTGYPDCDFATWEEPVPEKCPTCKGLMTISKRKKIPVCKECGFEDKEIK